MKMKAIAPFLAAAIAAALPGQAAHAQTGFAYQGRVKQGGTYLTGTADFRFSLFATAVGGSALETIFFEPGGDESPLTVTDGLFNAQLDFDDAHLDGSARWLEVQVRYPSGGGAFTTVTPRQPVSAVPYAIHAYNGGGGGLWSDNGNGVYTDGPVLVNVSAPWSAAQLTAENINNAPAIVGRTSAAGDWPGVWGRADNNGFAALADGVLGETVSGNGAGVVGIAQVGAPAGSTPKGIHGVCTHPNFAATGWAGYFEGRGYFSGNVGIGTASPSDQASLHVHGVANDGSSAPLRVSSGEDGGFLLIDENELDRGGSSGALYLQNNSIGDVVLCGGGGDTGIGSNSTGFRLHVFGSAGKPGGGSWSDSSDARLKKNIAPLEHSLDRLLNLRGVTYEWIEPEKHGNLSGGQIGMIAQDVEPHFPQWVGEDNDGYKTLGFTGFEALTVEALRELRAEKDAAIAELEETNRAQQAQIEDLSARLARLEARLTGRKEIRP